MMNDRIIADIHKTVLRIAKEVGHLTRRVKGLEQKVDRNSKDLADIYNLANKILKLQAQSTETLGATVHENSARLKVVEEIVESNSKMLKEIKDALEIGMGIKT